MANPFIKKDAKKGAIAKALSTPFFGSKENRFKIKYPSKNTPESKLKSEADWKKYNDAIIAKEQAKQKPKVETLSPVVVAKDNNKVTPESKPVRATRASQSEVKTNQKGATIKPIAAPTAGNITKRATTKTDAQKKAAGKAGDVRQRGTDALKAGNLSKAKRLSRRYQNLKKKM